MLPLIKVWGKTILVKKERIDLGGMRATPALEEDGKKNLGKIMAVGQIGLYARLMGVRKDATVYFRRHFTANADSSDSMVFVNLEDVLGILKK